MYVTFVQGNTSSLRATQLVSTLVWTAQTAAVGISLFLFLFLCFLICSSIPFLIAPLTSALYDLN